MGKIIEWDKQKQVKINKKLIQGMMYNVKNAGFICRAWFSDERH